MHFDCLSLTRFLHIINLFVDIKPSHENSGLFSVSRNDYSMVSAEQGDFIY